MRAATARPQFKSTDITGAPYGQDARAHRPHTASRARLEDFRGKVVVLFFGFTHCPDICPTTLAEIAQAVKTLGPDAERVQVLIVSVDPERDTPEALAQVRHRLRPALPRPARRPRGDASRWPSEFKIYFEKRKTGDSYTVDHSAQSYVIDPQGRLRLLVRHDRIGSDLPHDLKVLLAEKP